MLGMEMMLAKMLGLTPEQMVEFAGQAKDAIQKMVAALAAIEQGVKSNGDKLDALLAERNIHVGNGGSENDNRTLIGSEGGN